MRTELAKQLLKDIIEPIVNYDESEAEDIFRELQFFGEYKYDHYEMYAPGRHFLEHLFIWLSQFAEVDRKVALSFVLNNLVFYSRREFELLTKVLYWNVIRKSQLGYASIKTGIQNYKVHKLSNSREFAEIQRSSLYIGMSDGARIDYFRRQNRNIGNEQIIATYHIDGDKCNDMIYALRKDLADSKAKFKALFLIDDFCASGTTLIRLDDDSKIIKGTLNQLEKKLIPFFTTEKTITSNKSINMLEFLLDNECQVFLCPLLATQKSVDHINSLKANLSSYLKNIVVNPASIIDEKLELKDYDSELAKLCKNYYQERMGDDNTKSVVFGYRSCGLPVVLHHNTPNNSLYILWNRRAIEQNSANASFHPLFKRIERHKTNG